MSQPITNITIAHVSNDRAVIALLLEYLGLFKTRKICVMPDFKRNQLCYTAYIEVAEWCDREAAYNLIQKIKDPRKEARIVYADDEWWAVEETLEEDLRFTQGSAFAKWTTEFNQVPVPFAEEKYVTFKRGLAIEESITIEDLDMRIACKDPNLDFNAFCVGFGLAHGFDFEAEFNKWETEEQLLEAVEKNLEKIQAQDQVQVQDTVIEMGF
jgi:hypothetical protein